MRIEFDRARWSQDSEGFWLSLMVNAPQQARQFVEGMQDKLYDAELKIHRERRSLDANAYLWEICQKIAEAVGGRTKEDVYQEAVIRAGKFDFILCKPEAVETFVHNWQSRGIGWIAEKTDVTAGGFQQIVCYYGSSVYDTKEMSVLLEHVVDEAQDLDIETRTPDEIAKMEALWT